MITTTDSLQAQLEAIGTGCSVWAAPSARAAGPGGGAAAAGSSRGFPRARPPAARGGRRSSPARAPARSHQRRWRGQGGGRGEPARQSPARRRGDGRCSRRLTAPGTAAGQRAARFQLPSRPVEKPGPQPDGTWPQSAPSRRRFTSAGGGRRAEALSPCGAAAGFKMQLTACFFLGCGIFLASGYNSFSKSMETIGKKQYQVQHGSCSYTFLLPETDNCRSSTSYVSNAVQRDAPLDYDDSVQRLQLLENIMENNTQWLMKLENYIQDSMKKEMVEIQQTAVQNQTAVMIEIGTNLLNQTAEQTRKLTDVEAQVLNQTTRLELQLLEHSLSTNKLERQISDQTNEITKLQEKNSFLEKRVLEMEDKHTLQLKSIKDEKDQLQVLVARQNSIIEELEKQLVTATVNNSVLQKQQHDLMETVHNLLTMISTPNAKNNFIAKEEQISFKDCAEAFKSGLTTSGIYTLTVSSTVQEKKAYCDMETGGGGWTVIQRREDGSVDFHRTWKEYKMGFGDPAGEYWLGNEFVSQLTNQKRYVLKIHLKDWEGNEAYALYDHFSLASEELKYRIYLKGLTGTAGKISSISQPGNDFSTKDADNDKCICKCSQMLTGGWWFDACGPSNLNGMYYPLRQNNNKFNGIKWYYWKGSGYSLKATTMMIRPADF